MADRIVERAPDTVVLHEHDDGYERNPAPSAAAIIALIIVAIIIIALLFWRPWATRSAAPSVNVPSHFTVQTQHQ